MGLRGEYPGRGKLMHEGAATRGLPQVKPRLNRCEPPCPILSWQRSAAPWNIS